jgi:hypothetical protein
MEVVEPVLLGYSIGFGGRMTISGVKYASSKSEGGLLRSSKCGTGFSTDKYGQIWGPTAVVGEKYVIYSRLKNKIPFLNYGLHDYLNPSI